MSLANDKAELLSRDAFRKGVLERDGYKCVICGAIDVKGPCLDAHHIIERRLWDDGGYYLDNGATLCRGMSGRHGCHMSAEETVLTCDEIRIAAKIKQILIPDHLYPDYQYDKWGNIIHPDGTRTPGELMHDESVRKVLSAGGVLPLFRTHIKYPRTFHLPWSPGLTDDDRLLPSTDVFKGCEVIMTEKMDGENTTMYHDYIHARSLDSGNHPSRGWVKNLHGQIQYDIPIGWRICCENLYAQHSVTYDDLPSYVMVFSMWNENNICLSWDETCEYAAVLGLYMVPTLYRGIWDEALIRSMKVKTDSQEGYVIRVTDAFPYGAFRKSVAKWVRKGHVQTTHNWMQRIVIPNRLKSLHI